MDSKRRSSDHLSPWGHVGHFCLWSIPVIGLIFWLFACCSKREGLRNYARSIFWFFVVLILCIALMLGLGLGMLSLGYLTPDMFENALTFKNADDIEFDIGAVNPLTGEPMYNFASVYTPNLLECIGLTLSPNSNELAEYQIFWYNASGVYFDCTSKINIQQTTTPDAVPNEAYYCRIVIYPSPLEASNFKIWPWSVSQYASLLSIDADKSNSSPKFEYVANALNNKYNGHDTFAGNKDLDKYIEIDSSSGLISFLYDCFLDVNFSPLNNQSIALGDINRINGRDLYILDVSDQWELRLVYSGLFTNQHFAVRFYTDKGSWVNYTGVPALSEGCQEYIIPVPKDAKYMCIELCHYTASDPTSNIEFDIYKHLPRNDITANYSK